MNHTKIIDIHSHFTTSEYLNMLEKHNAALEDGFPVPLWNIQEHLNLMEQCNIRWTLLSLSTPQPYFNGFEQESIDMCRQLNEQMAQIKRDYPNKFGFQATLPLPDIDASIEETIYALDCLGADGIKFPSNSRGLYLGVAELEPLMAELNKRHPLSVSGSSSIRSKIRCAPASAIDTILICWDICWIGILHFYYPFLSVLLTDCYKLISWFRFFFTICCFASRSAHSFFFSSSFLRREVFFSGFCSDWFTGCCSSLPSPFSVF